jgi:hypothetical protein
LSPAAVSFRPCVCEFFARIKRGRAVISLEGGDLGIRVDFKVTGQVDRSHNCFGINISLRAILPYTAKNSQTRLRWPRVEFQVGLFEREPRAIRSQTDEPSGAAVSS